MSFNPPIYKYADYVKWKGDCELIEGYPFAIAPNLFGKHQILSYMKKRKLIIIF